jgi:hypothetical protein
VSRKRNDDAFPRLVVGLMFVAFGAILWFDHIGAIEARDYVEYWPLAAIVMGLAHLPHRKWLAAIIWIAVGIYFSMPLIGLRHVHFWRIIGLWPLIISAGGVALVLQAFRERTHETSFRAIAVMGGNGRKIGAQFKGGEAVAVMGGCSLDFTSSTIAGGEAILDVVAFWGGVELKVPRGWKVISKISLLLGGLSMKVDEAPVDAPRLILRGALIGGGLDVRHPKEND